MSKANRLRLINAIRFFAERMGNVGTVKLFKLIYLLDFEHFQKTGRSVTGLEYQAWKLGPVPLELRKEWKSGFNEDLARLVSIKPERLIDHVRHTLVPTEGVAFDDSFFTPRQLGIMTELAERYGDSYADKMIDVTHSQNGAWEKVWRDGEGRNEVIPYELAIPRDSDTRSDVLEAAYMHAAFERAVA